MADKVRACVVHLGQRGFVGSGAYGRMQIRSIILTGHETSDNESLNATCLINAASAEQVRDLLWHPRVPRGAPPVVLHGG